MSDAIDAALAAVPDVPRWVDLRGMLVGGACDVFPNADPATGGCVRSREYDDVAMAWGAPDDAALAAVLGGLRVVQLGDPLPDAATRLPGWVVEEVVVHRFGAPPPPAGPPAGVEIAVAEEGEPWPDAADDHLSPYLRWEFGMVRSSGRPAAIAVADGRVVSVCYAAWRTETLWDVSVDTWEPWRRKGASRAAWEALTPRLAARGLTPVWAAYETNAASLGMAAALGFEPDSRLVSYRRPDRTGIMAS